MYFSLDSIGHPPDPLPPRGETMLPRLVGVTTALLAIALITLALRMWVRTRDGFLLGWDDAVMAMATVVTIANWAVLLAINVKTKGLHTWYIPMPVFEDIARVSFVFVTLWVWSVSLVKISVCFMLLRIKSSSRPWLIGLWGLILVIFGTSVAVTVAYMFMCSPIQANWELKYLVQPDTCWSIDTFIKFTYGFSSLFVLTDVACALLPIAFISRIKRPLREKVTLALLMALGLLACVCGLMKMVLLRRTLFSSDPVYDGVITQIWSSAEAYIGITAANIPCLKSLLEKVFHLFGGRMTTTGRVKHGYHQDDYEMNKKFQHSNQDPDTSYHSAVRSIQGTRATMPRSDSERDLIDERFPPRFHGPNQDSYDGFKNCYVTKEYEVSWEDSMPKGR